MKNDDQISKLLRLKRYECPPKGFHEEFLREFQRRQRAALMQPTAWDVIRNFIQDRLLQLTPATYAYASVVILALTISTIMLRESPSQNPLLSSTPSLTHHFSLNAPASLSDISQPLASQPSQRFTQIIPQDIPHNLLQKPVSNEASTPLPPQYILQTQPVRYEAPFSF